ncbi:MAG: hypothetical protein FGM33_08335 [Candidatus Kapabacteria bacterium]|nr:hypothetical protein [Candidatus Kapabacteria bacterium]
MALLFFLSLIATGDSVVVVQSSMAWNIDACQRSVFVAQPQIFNSGDRILLHAGVCTVGPDSNHYQAGDWSWNVVDTVAAGRLWLRYSIAEPLAQHPVVQIVQAYQPPDGIIDRRISTRQWNGTCGGVIAVWSDSDIDLRGPISASGAGFAAPYPTWNDRDTSDLTDPAATTSIHRGDGQGACSFQAIASGTHPWFLGGKSGRARNSGGSGGNGAAGGGRGGSTSSAFQSSSHAPGGRARPMADSARLVFGTAGGSGHGNDLDGGVGGAGGGIIVIRCGRLRMHPGSIISADGVSGKDASHDGAGGGGGGGMIVLDADSVEGDVTISARGGHGGSTSSTLFVSGPGGGGAGGSVMAKLVSNASVRVNVQPGTAGSGRVSIAPVATTDHGALDGEPGRIITTAYRWRQVADRGAHPRLVCTDSVVERGATATIRLAGSADVNWIDAVTTIDNVTWRTPAINAGRWFRARIVLEDGCASIDSVHVRPRPTSQTLTVSIGDVRAKAGDSVDIYLSVRTSAPVGRNFEGIAYVSTHPRVLLPAGGSGRVHDSRTRLALPFRLTTTGTSTYRRDRLVAVLGDSAAVQLSIDSVVLSTSSGVVSVRRMHGSFTLEDLCVAGGRPRLISSDPLLLIRGRKIITSAPEVYVCDVLGRILTRHRNTTSDEREFEIEADIGGLVFVVVGGEGWLRSVPVWLSPGMSR